MKKYRLLMLTTLIISGCSICYELIISAVSSYLMGDSTLQYSITIGLYMSAMGLGSYLSKYMKEHLFNWFVLIEIGVGLVGGTSALALFYANLYLETYQIVMYLEIIVIGTFVGAEIPLLTRIIEDDHENLRITLSSIFSFDYIGGLVGSIAFPLLLLPQLGYFATAFLTGCMNLAAAVLIIFRYSGRIRKVRIYKAAVLVSLFFMVGGTLFSDNISNRVENGLYRDKVILSEQTQYQHIVMTKHKDDLRLYIDGNVQFSSLDEYRYHEALVHIPMAKAAKGDKVLVLGGGDGLAVRELLKYEETKITLVDLDEQMVSLCSENPNITELNEGALKSDRLTLVCRDAYQFLEETEEKFDVILVDLPDPNNEALNKLYTNVFYRLCGNALTKDGVMTVQSTSPYYAADAFWCINETLKSEGFYVKPYHLQVPSFGDWGFNLASKREMSEKISLEADTRYLSEDNLEALFVFGKDELPKGEVEINSLSKPALMAYYGEAVRNWE
ncbi:MAG: polyamine aminopropyltransferase [Clostridiales bacterium]|nr:polyamine aminopropyltransferase [Clostridiales bacterium]